MGVESGSQFGSTLDRAGKGEASSNLLVIVGFDLVVAHIRDELEVE